LTNRLRGFARRQWRMILRAASILSALLLALLAACNADIDAGEEPPAPGAPTARAGRCLHCGWIESKREVPSGAADAGAAKSYEYTVRMTDGSSRVFRESLPATWRLRERLTVLGGAAAPD
jgi:hypothetical protein